MTTAPNIREALGAGRWFPGRAAELKSVVAGYIEAADHPAVKGRIVSAIAPHAGYIYSGPVAGHTFRALRDNAATHPVSTVVLLGFTHRQSFAGVALMDGGAIRTPLGETPLDRASGETIIRASGCARWDYAPHAGEWSAENEIPFVQSALPDAKLVVGLFGDHAPATVTGMIKGLMDAGRQQPLVVVASTDMLHDPDYAKVAQTDRQTLKLATALDAEGIRRHWEHDSQIFCGLMPVLAAIGYAQALGCGSGTLLHYRNSGDDFPESRGEWVVGYGAMVYAVS